jgi:lipopolysaccharide export system permease protein
MADQQATISSTPPHTHFSRYLGLKRIDWYIIKKFLSTFFFVIILFAAISCIIDYSEKVDNIVSKKAPTLAVLNYYKNFVPHIVALLFPLFIFIATLFFTSKIAYKSEIIAILSSGVSFSRFLRPYLVGGGFLCLVSLISNHWVIPAANNDRIYFENHYINDDNFRWVSNNLHLGISKNTYVYIQNFNVSNSTGNRFTAEKIEGTQLKEKLMAEYISYDTAKKIWKLSNVVIRNNNGMAETVRRVPEMEMKYPFTPSDLNSSDAIKEALTTPQLNRYIENERLRGQENLSFFYVEKARRSAEPVAGLILTIMGACIASRKIRGGSGFHLAVGIALSAIYIMFQKTTTTFAIKSNLDPMLAVWIPNIIFGAYAFYLYRKQTK